MYRIGFGNISRLHGLLGANPVDLSMESLIINYQLKTEDTSGLNYSADPPC